MVEWKSVGNGLWIGIFVAPLWVLIIHYVLCVILRFCGYKSEAIILRKEFVVSERSSAYYVTVVFPKGFFEIQTQIEISKRDYERFYANKSVTMRYLPLLPRYKSLDETYSIKKILCGEMQVATYVISGIMIGISCLQSLGGIMTMLMTLGLSLLYGSCVWLCWLCQIMADDPKMKYKRRMSEIERTVHLINGYCRRECDKSIPDDIIDLILDYYPFYLW